MMRLRALRYQLDYGIAADGAVFGPALMVGSLAATAAGGALSASSTLAGGDYAEAAGQAQKKGAYAQADQLDANASQSIAASQRKMLDTRQRAKLLESTSIAKAAGSGVDAGTGSALTNTQEIAERGSYQALMDLFNGKSEATGLQNQAKSVRYSGDLAEIEGKAKKNQAKLSALGTLASTAGSLMSTYGKFAYPTSSGSSGASV